MHLFVSSYDIENFAKIIEKKNISELLFFITQKGSILSNAKYEE